MLNTGLNQREVQGESGRRRGLKSGSWEDLGPAATRRQKHEMASVSTIEPARRIFSVTKKRYLSRIGMIATRNHSPMLAPAPLSECSNPGEAKATYVSSEGKRVGSEE